MAFDLPDMTAEEFGRNFIAEVRRLYEGSGRVDLEFERAMGIALQVLAPARPADEDGYAIRPTSSIRLTGHELQRALDIAAPAGVPDRHVLLNADLVLQRYPTAVFNDEGTQVIPAGVSLVFADYPEDGARSLAALPHDEARAA